MNRVSRMFVLILATLGASLLGMPIARAQHAAGDAVAAVCMGMATEIERNACLRGAAAAQEADTPPASSDEARQVPAESGRGFLGLGVFGGADAGRELGAEMVGTVERTPDTVRATIVSFAERVPGILTFNLDNGQVWRQVSTGEAFFLPEGEEIPVEMWSSWAGGYRMRLLDERLVLRVERIR